MNDGTQTPADATGPRSACDRLVCVAGVEADETQAPGSALGRYLNHKHGYEIRLETDGAAEAAELMVVDHSALPGVTVQAADLRLFRVAPGNRSRRVIYIGAVAGGSDVLASWLLVVDQRLVELDRVDALLESYSGGSKGGDGQ
jgi:hypothetical protein